MVGEMSQTSIIITDGTTLILANGFPLFLGERFIPSKSQLCRWWAAPSSLNSFLLELHCFSTIRISTISTPTLSFNDMGGGLKIGVARFDEAWVFQKKEKKNEEGGTHLRSKK